MKAQTEADYTNYLMCTEVCVANIDQTIDYSNNYGSWIELYNPSIFLTKLNGWYVSDDADELTKHRLKGYSVMMPRGYQCIFFDHYSTDGLYGPNAEKQVGFKLNRKGGNIYFSKDGTKVDFSITYPESIPRCSYARIKEETNEWQYCGTPTPGKPNSGPYAQECLAVPLVDCDSRLFTTEFDVHVQIPSGTTLHYTTDGSTPTLANGKISSDGLFHVSKTTTLRLRLFSDNKLPSGIVTRNYIYKDRNYYLPIVAITTDPKNLYDDMIGCYTQGKNGITGRGSNEKSNLNMDWVRPVNFEYLTAEGKMAINQETSFEVAGGYSRHFAPASFKVQAKKLYDGNGHFGYPVFDNKPYCEYKQLLIRNGGNNNRTDGGPRIKDAITQQVLTTSGFYVDAQEFQPAHVFINGKYLAMMNVREPNNRYHGVANYGYDEDEMDGFEYSTGSYHQRGGTREAFDDLMMKSYEADTEEGYAHIAEILDVDEFARYMAAVCYSGTGDWVLNSNNVKAYRSRNNGKFHFVFFDQDLTWEKSNNVVEIEGNEILDLYHRMKWNKKFQQEFVAAYCILHGSIYTPERCRKISDSICTLVKEALSFDNRYTTTTYNKLKSTMWDESHREARIKALIEAYRLPNRINVNVSTNCAFAKIQMGGIDVPFNKFTGVLFEDIPVTTNSAEGYRFLGWRDQDGKWLSRESECHFCKDGTYTAVYEQTTTRGVAPICINEISTANDIYVNEYGKRADWIELYNRTQEPIDVTGLFFSDEASNPTKYQIDAADGVSTIIQPNDHLVIWCDEKPSISQLHLPFKLKNMDNGYISIQSSNGRWKDIVKYDELTPKESIGRIPDGGSTFHICYHPTIGGFNMSTTYDSLTSFSPGTMVSSPSSDDIISIVYYNLEGEKVQPHSGIYIKVAYYPK